MAQKGGSAHWYTHIVLSLTQTADSSLPMSVPGRASTLPALSILHRLRINLHVAK